MSKQLVKLPNEIMVMDIQGDYSTLTPKHLHELLCNNGQTIDSRYVATKRAVQCLVNWFNKCYPISTLSDEVEKLEPALTSTKILVINQYIELLQYLDKLNERLNTIKSYFKSSQSKLRSMLSTITYTNSLFIFRDRTDFSLDELMDMPLSTYIDHLREMPLELQPITSSEQAKQTYCLQH